ncbi:MAG: RNA-binding protein, partial [Bacteroidota bacterium]
QLTAIQFNSCWIENKGNLQFEVHALPAEAQLAPVYGILTKDVNGDGYLDLLLNGNEFSMAPALGRNDGFNGVVLMGNGKNFKALSPQQSGFYVAGNGKALIELAVAGNDAVMASQNFGPLKTFKQTGINESVTLLPDDRYVTITLQNGQTRKQEYYWGAGFLSQSPNQVSFNSSVRAAEVTNRKGEKRKLK